MNDQDQVQLQLPYIEITDVANRDYLRANFKRAPRDTYFIPLNQIQEREGYNKRKVYEDIPELADSILAHGLTEPFWLNILSNGTAYIVRGHRRFRAYQLLVEANKFPADGLVEFQPVKANVTEMQMLLDQHISNNFQKKMKPIERSNLAYELKFNFGATLTHEAIAEMMCISRQHVDNLIKIGGCDDALKNEMLMLDMGITECISFINKKKKSDKQATDAELEANKNTAGKTPLPHDINAQEAAELNDLLDEKNDLVEEVVVVETPEETEQRLVREAAQAEKDMEELLKIADEVKVSKLKQHLNRKLAKDAVKSWKEDFVDEDNGEVVNIERHSVVYKKNTVLDETIVENIQNEGVKTVFLYKPGCEPVSVSVITEPVAQPEKDKYDMDRPEMAAIQNVIRNNDKIEAIINKLDVPEGTKKDIADLVKWNFNSLEIAREWIHKHKQQNKMR